MRHVESRKRLLLLPGVFAVLFASTVFFWRDGHGASRAAEPAGATPAAAPDELARLKAEVARLRGMVPDQSHAMADVGYHFTNLWFAGEARNWPLAQFCADEVRSHLRWAVRIIPIRKDRDGREVDLGGILAALEQSSLKELSETIRAKDKSKFEAAYRTQMENCMACHRASAKEFVRLKIPERPAADVLDFTAVEAAGPAAR
jgi:hypothetical protein